MSDPLMHGTLSRWEWRSIRSALRQQQSKLKRKIDPDFVPEPGKMDSNKARLATNKAALRKVEEILNAGPDRS